MTNRKQKPASAYQHYRKLVHDFDLLEREMESHQDEQSELEAQLEQAKARIRTSQAQDQQTRQIQWELERDRQLESCAEQRSTVDALRAQTEALEVQELHLQAEVEVLRERQQETSETEAHQIHRLIQERSTLLEEELAKGKIDLDYIAQVVSSTQRQRQQHEGDNKLGSSVQNLVESVQERRRRDFEVAEAKFKARIRSLQLEEDAITEKSNTLRDSKQRAIQILSQNQQLAIKAFFDTPPNTQQKVETLSTISSLNYEEILQFLNESGAQTEHIPSIESLKPSGRRVLAEALQEARTTLENGTERVEAMKKSLQDRRIEAEKLGFTVDHHEIKSCGYDGKWGIESYSPRQYGMIYFVRGLVFSWMEIAVAEVENEPVKELLEFEVKRWQETHESVEHDCTRARNLQLAGQIFANLMNDVVAEMAEDIRLEFEANSHRVRNICTNAYKNVFFPAPNEKLQTKSIHHTALRSSLFESSLGYMRILRNLRNDSKSIALMHQSSLPVLQQAALTTLASSTVHAKSPVKRTFGLFFGISRSVSSPAKKEMTAKRQISTTPVTKVDVISYLSPDEPVSLLSTNKISISFWFNAPHFRLQTVLIPSSLGHSSCLQVSLKGDLLVCGTTEGELLLWDLLPDEPVILRRWSPPKAERSRVTRVLLSPDAQIVVAFFRRKSVAVFSVNSSPTRSNPHRLATHSKDCFPIDPAKFKPQTLDLLLQLSTADALAQISFSTDLRDRAPSAVAKDPSTGWSASELTCGSFCTSFSLTGMVVDNISLLFGTSSGDLLKLNLGQDNSEVQAMFDSPTPNDTELRHTTRIRREFFRGHHQTVLFVSCIHRMNAQSGNKTEILSVDQSGVVCIWEYNTTQFTGFGWFVPKVKLQLELSLSNSNLNSVAQPDKLGSDVLTGEMLQVALTPDDTRLVCMVFYSDPLKKSVAGTLRFLQVLTECMKLDRVLVNVEFVGGNGAPRFALTTNFLLLLANNLVHVYALHTGMKARKPIKLAASAQQQLSFHNITCSTSKSSNQATTTRRHREDSTSTVTFIVSSDQHSRLLVHSFTASNTPSTTNKTNGKRRR